MRKSLLCALLIIISERSFATVYTWMGGTAPANEFRDQSNWSTAGVGGAAVGPAGINISFTNADVLTINGNNVGGGATGAVQVRNAGGTINIGQLILTNSANFSIRSSNNTRTYNLGNGISGVALNIGTGSTLVVGSTGISGESSPINMNLATNNTASIAGVLDIGNENSVSVFAMGTPASASVTSTGTYRHGSNRGALPVFTWNNGATCEITGITDASPDNSFNQNFNNLIWNCTGQAQNITLNGNLTAIGGDFTVKSTGAAYRLILAASETTTLTVTGDLNIDGGNLVLSSSSATVTVNITGTTTISAGSLYGATGTGATNILNANGNFVLSGGTLDLFQSGASGNITVNLKGNFNMSSGTITKTTAATGSFEYRFNKNGTQTFVKTGGSISSNATGPLKFYIDSDATLDMATYVLDGSNVEFESLEDAGIITANTDAAGAISRLGANGSIQVTGDREYNTTTNFTFNGTSPQFTGDAITSSFEKELTIDNNAGVTLTESLTFRGNSKLILKSGTFNIGNRTVDFNGEIVKIGGNINAETTNSTLIFRNKTYYLFAGLFTNNSIHHLILTGTSGLQLRMEGDLTIKGTLTLNNGELRINDHTLTLAGDIVTNGGSINANQNSTVKIEGPSSLVSGLFTNNTVYNLNINRSGGVSMNSGLIVSGILTLTNGTFNIGANVLILSGPAIAGTATNLITTSFSKLFMLGSHPGVFIPSSITNLEWLAIDNSNGVILNSDLTVEDLSLTSGELYIGSNTLTLAYGATRINGSITSSINSTVVITDSSLFVVGSFTIVDSLFTNNTVNNLTINRSGGVVLDRNLIEFGYLTVNGTLTLTSGEFNIGIEGTLTLAGDITRTSGTITCPTYSTVVITGAPSLPDGLFTGNALNYLHINRSNGVSLNSNLIINGTLHLTSGTFTIEANKTLTLNSVLKTSGIISATANSGVTIAGNTLSTLTSNWFINSTVHHLTINKINGGVSMEGDITINGTLTLTSGNFSVLGNTLTLNGPAIAGTATNLIITSFSSLAMGGSTAGIPMPSHITALNNLTITNSNGVDMSSNLTINGILTLTIGAFNVGSNTLTLDGPPIGGITPQLITDTSSSLVMGGSSYGTYIPASVTSLQSLAINNVNGVSMSDDFTVTDLILTNGELNVGVNTLTIYYVSRTNGKITAGSSSTLISIDADFPSSLFSNDRVQNLTIAGSLPVIMGSNLTINGTLTLNNIFTVGNNTLTLAGDVVVNSGTINTLTTTNSTVEITGPASFNSNLFPNNRVRNLILNRGGGVSMQGSLQILNSLTLTNGEFALINGSTLIFDGNVSRVNGSINTSVNTTVRFNNSGPSSFTDGLFTSNEVYNLHINRVGGVTMNSNLTVNGTLTLTNGAFNIGTNTITLNGPAVAGIVSNLSTTSSSSLAMGGSSSGISVPSHIISVNNLTISNSNGIDMSNGLTVNGILTLNSVFNIGSHTLTLNGPSFAGNAGNLTTTFQSSLIIGGAYATPLPIKVPHLGNLTINRTGGATVGHNLVIVGALTLTNGVLLLEDITTLSLSGTISRTAGSITSTALSTVTILVLPILSDGLFTNNSIHNLEIANNNGVSMGSSLTVSGKLILNGGALIVGSQTLTLAGSVEAYGSSISTTSASTVILTGSPTLETGIFNGNNVHGLIINSASNTVSLNSNLTVSTSFTLTSGALLITGGNTLTLSGSITRTSGSITADANSIVSATTASIPAGLFTNNTVHHLNIIRGAGNSISMGGDLTVNGTLTLTTGSLVIAPGKTLILAGGLVKPGGSLLASINASAANSTVVFIGPSSIPPGLFTNSDVHNLTIDRNGGVTMAGNINVQGTLTLSSGELNVGSMVLILNGSAGRTSGSITTTNNSYIVINNASSFSLVSGLFTAGTVTNLDIEVGNTASMESDLTITETFRLLGGELNIGSNTLTLGGEVGIYSTGITSTSGSTVVITGYTDLASIIFTSNTVNNLTFNNNNNGGLPDNLTINGTLNLVNGDLYAWDVTLTLNGPPISGTTTRFKTNAGTSLIMGGSSSGTFIPSSVTQLAALTINNTAGTAASGNIALSGQFTINSSGVFNAGAYQLTGNNGTWNINGTLRTANTNGFANGASKTIPSATVALGPSSTIEYNASSGTQAVDGRTDYAHLTFSGAAAKNIGSGTEVGGNFTVSGGAVTPPGVMTFDGTSAQNIAGLAYDSVSIKGAGNKTFTTDGSVSSAVIFTPGQSATVDFDGPANDKIFTVLSTAAKTAWIGNIASYTVTGNIKAERYHPSRRAWRLVAAPVSTGSIFNNWQDSGFNRAGRGLLITGPNPNPAVNGLDYSAQNTTTLYTYNVAGNSWTAVNNTRTAGINDVPGYLIFIRGDRDPNNTIIPNTNVTTVHSLGGIKSNNQQFTTNANPLGYTLIGNPYPSPINFASAYTDPANGGGSQTTNVQNKFYVLDPAFGDRGAYVALSDDDNDGIYSTSNILSTQTKQIQSGQAFFVQTTASGAGANQFTIKEKDKYPVDEEASRPGTQRETIALVLSRVNTDSSLLPVDGALAVFSNTLSDVADAADATKFTNFDEAISFVQAGRTLSIMGSPLADANDTLFIKISAMKQANYQLGIHPNSFNAPGLMAFLEDAFTGTSTALSLSAVTNIPFSISTNAASSAANRFRIVFKGNSALPVSFLNIKAYEKASAIEVEWAIASEYGVSSYEVEESANAVSFTRSKTVYPKANDNSMVRYAWTDNNVLTGANYYRVKSIAANGEIKISPIVRVNIGKGQAGVSVYPNPVTGNSFNLQMSGMEAGNYTLRLFNTSGQKVFDRSFKHNGGSATQSIIMDRKLPAGVYQMVIQHSNGNQQVHTFIAND